MRRLALRTLMLVLCSLVLAGTAFAGQPDPDRYIVKFRDGAAGPGQAALQAAGAQVLLELGPQNAAAARIPAQALAGLANNPHVEYVEVDVPRFPMAETIPYGVKMVQADQTDAAFSEVTTGGGAGRKVCIIDSGYSYGHEDLRGSDISGYPSGWDTDKCGHGTHVAGSIAAITGNNTGVASVAESVSLFIVKVFGDDCSWTYASNLIDATNRCANAGANVISMSLGCSGRFCKSSTEESAFNTHYANGILSVAAAGNAGNTQLSYPASYNSVVSVAAVDSTGTVASFSQQNSQVELAGPGVWVLSTVPTGAGYNVELVVDGAAYEAGAMQYSATGSATGGLADCGLAGSTCSGVSGKVCLIERGTYTFYDKVKNCQAGGGVAAAIYNNVAGGFSGTLGETNDTTIPAVGISQADGQYLKANKLGASATVTLQTGNYDRYDGTSMATPHVSAVAALVWSHDTSKSNDQVRKALQNTAWDANGGGKDNALGYGIVQAQAALDNLQGGGGGGGCTVTESPETSCSDGVDNDCDGKVDLDDTDCQTGGSCNVTGASCGVNSDCCSGSCKGKPGSKTCK